MAPATIGGTMNPIVVTDNRGSLFGWTLSAEMPDLTSLSSNNISDAQLAVAPTCTPATSDTIVGAGSDSSALDYTTGLPIEEFDATNIAAGAVAGASQTFDNTVNLCTKDLTVNGVTDSTSGVWNVTGPLTLVVPAFQAADTYTSTIVITLA